MKATRDEIALAMQHICRVLDVQMPTDSTTIGEYFDDLLGFEIQELRESVKAIKRGDVFVRSGHFPSVKDFHLGVKAYRDLKKKAVDAVGMLWSGSFADYAEKFPNQINFDDVHDLKKNSLTKAEFEAKAKLRVMGKDLELLLVPSMPKIDKVFEEIGENPPKYGVMPDSIHPSRRFEKANEEEKKAWKEKFAQDFGGQFTSVLFKEVS